MPNLLTLPRELRDEIYRHFITQTPPATPHRTPIPPKQSSPLSVSVEQSQRSSSSIIKRFSRLPPHTPSCVTSNSTTSSTSSTTTTTSSSSSSLGSNYVPHESTIRYPIQQPTPHTAPLLFTANHRLTHDLHTHLSSTRTPIAFLADVRLHTPPNLLYPTWISVPASTALLARLKRSIDVLDVNLRMRMGKTGTVCTVNDCAEVDEVEGLKRRISRGGRSGSWANAFDGGLVLLWRFLEGGIGFGVKGVEGKDGGDGKGDGWRGRLRWFGRMKGKKEPYEDGDEISDEEEGSWVKTGEGEGRKNETKAKSQTKLGKTSVHVNLFILNCLDVTSYIFSEINEEVNNDHMREVFDEVTANFDHYFYMPGYDNPPHYPFFEESNWYRKGYRESNGESDNSAQLHSHLECMHVANLGLENTSPCRERSRISCLQMREYGTFELQRAATDR
ncbi:uncharacterized protein PADG_00319 [Paracoccidioides brasiliensis Pb18]|uniref:Uncharacterized protein n=1 Tax=Paracoccidioides brasiliensis (strain Pb18) TaxID=502780 RepID=C1G0C9_PARBD|nr:uncharacterized protein PADG_00319 [Paracoccidioides brasiliensis Pb18]EEH44030.2 hypothetical protein PADG_00319 [Paracoccidioides brasiliensis Pb18]